VKEVQTTILNYSKSTLRRTFVGLFDIFTRA